MQYRSKKLLSLLLAVLMIVSLLPSAAFATEGDDSVYVEYDESTPDTPVVEEEVVDEEVVNEPTDPAEGEETPAEETPVEETPAEETPAEEDEVEEDYAPMPINDGTDEDEPTTYPVYIGEQGYDSLQAAINAASDNDTIVLNEDITSKFDVQGKTLTIDLNNHTLTLPDEGNYSRNGANTTIKNGTIILDKAGSSSNGFLCSWKDTGCSPATLTLDNVTVTTPEAGTTGLYVFNVFNTCTLNLQNGTTVDVSKGLGTGKKEGVTVVYADGGTVNIDNSTVTAVDVNRGFMYGTVTIDNSTVSITASEANTTGIKNGFLSSTVTVKNGSAVTISDCTEDSTRAGIDGGTLTIESGSVAITDSNATIAGKATVTVSESATLTVDKAPADDVTVSGTITDTSATPAATDFAAFLKALETAVEGGNVVFDGQGMTVTWSPENGEVVAETVSNTPAKVNNGNAQYIILTGKTNVTIKNVNFVYVPADFALTGNTGNAGSFTASNVPNAQLYLVNTGDTVIENCSFDKVVFTSWSNTGKTEVKGCSFKNIYNSYAIKDLGGTTASVTNCTFTNCGGGIMTNSNSSRTGSTTLTISGNTFEKIDVDGTAASDKVGTRGVLQFAANTAFAGLTIGEGNTATNCGPILRQLSTSAVNYVANNLEALKALAGTDGALYTSDTTDNCKPAETAEVATLADLQTALAAGKSVVLANDITLGKDEYLVETAVKGVTIDLNGKTLTLCAENKNQFEDLTIKNGTLSVSTYDGDEAYNGLITTTGISTVSNVKITSTGYAAYAFFNVASGSLTLDTCTFDVKGAASTGSGVLYLKENATLTLNDCSGTMENAGKFITNGVTTNSGTINLTNSNLTIKRTGEGISEHGINGGYLTIDGGSLIIDGLTGRGLTMSNNTSITVKNGAAVSVTNCTEATIKIKSGSTGSTISVNDTSSVTVDNSGTDTTTGLAGVTYISYVAEVSGTKYETLAAAVTAAEDGDTIKVLADSTGDGITFASTFTTAGLTIDFQNHSYTVGADNALAGSTGTKDQVFQLLKDNNITLKNGTLTSTNSACNMIIQNYSNLTLENMTLDAVACNANYALSNNCGNTSIIGNTSIKAAEGKTAFDLYSWPTNGYTTPPTVTVNTTGDITGKVVLWSDKNNDPAKLVVENGVSSVTLACGTVENNSGTALTVTAKDGYAITQSGNTYTGAVAVAKVGETGYATLAEAAAAATDGQTVTLLADIKDAGAIYLPAGVTLKGNGKTLSGNSAIHINAAGGTVQNVNFENIHNDESKLSAIYASGLTGKATITGCTFNSVDWDAIQIVPKANAEIAITGNTFTGTIGKRCIHIEASTTELPSYKATIKNNILNATPCAQGALCIYYFDKDCAESNFEIGSNYINGAIAIATYTSSTDKTVLNYAEQALPLCSLNDDGTLGDAIEYKAAILYKWGCNFHTDFASAIAEVNQYGSCTIKLLDDVTITESVNIGALDGITFDGNGKTITINSTDNGNGIVGLRFNKTKNPTIKNLTVTGTADQAIRLDSCGQATLDHVTITGNYYTDTANYALNFANTGGGTLKDCNIVGVFKNGAGGDNNKLTLENSEIGTLYLNYTETPGGVALTSDNASTIENFYNCIGDSYTENVHATNTVYPVARFEYNGKWYTYFSLQDAVTDAEGVDDATIVLMRDAEGAGVVFAAGKHTGLTIDFNGYTYNATSLVGSSGTESNGFQILKGNDVTLTNGTFKSTVACSTLIQNYSDLTLKDMTLDLTESTYNRDPVHREAQIIVLSNNCGTTEITGNTSITAPEGKVAFDVSHWGSYDAPTVIVNTTGTITGDVEITAYNGCNATTNKLQVLNGKFVGTFNHEVTPKDQNADIAISGGTFTTEIEQAWCADGFSPVSLGNGLYGVTNTPVVQKGEAAIGDTVYATLNDALTAAKASGTVCNIQLRSNVATAPAAIDFAVNIVNIGGYLIDGDLASDVLTAASGYILTDVGEMGMIFKISQGNNIYVAEIDGTQYTTVEAALAAAKSGETVELIANANEPNTTLLLNEGVTLDLGVYTLTAKALFGVNGSYVTGTVYSATSDAYAKLNVGTLKLGETALKGPNNYDLLPVKDTTGVYVFTEFGIMEQANGFSYDQENDSISYSFGRVITGAVRKAFLQDGSSDNDFEIRVQICWTDSEGIETKLDYLYKDEFVRLNMADNSSKVFAVRLEGLTELGIGEYELANLTVTAMAVTGSGLSSVGTAHGIN